MSLGPREVDLLTLAEMRLLVRSWNEAHGGEDEAPAAPSDDEYFELLEMMPNV
ncbi:hypothetical protein [Neomegalonema sp.]|uniref:hypothetical protein n=1 Tax=Neomegalonema sp. TaxID=2039713 RepID=UPI00262D0DC5|nr:hypothetical protein [Neomegalonema sp.]MDD2870302.1 hypothetical protein [Neomegalonema sp.]